MHILGMRLHTTFKGEKKLCPREDDEFKRELMEENVPNPGDCQ